MSRVAVHWCTWLGVVAFALALRFTRYADGDDRSVLGISYMLGTWIAIMILHHHESALLMDYREEHHPDTWRKLADNSGYKSIGRSWNKVAWLYSRASLGDPEVERLKRDVRRFYTFALVVFFSFLIVMPALTFQP